MVSCLCSVDVLDQAGSYAYDLGIIDSASELPDHAIPGCPLSSEGLLFIRNQLENCVSNPGHDCEPPLTIEITRWPARVLEIYHNSVVLVDFDSDVMPGKFAALSYCWGSPSELQLKPPYKAVASTVQDLRSGISAAELPLTIQQALLVCKWLDIRYIWIDSLCILQDSAQDWETEATKMETVYSMSKVTIIAGSSTSCHSGFLGVDLHSVQLRTPLDASFQLTASTLCTSGFHKLKREGHPYDPLDTRGWTFQEEFLSSRYLKFTKDDIQWKCSAGSTCMCGQPASEDYHGLWGETHPTIINQRPWESLAEEFSHRGFTKDTDKLVAISSLAKKLAPEFPAPNGQAAYVAGLWRSKLVQQLSWYVFDKLGRCPDNYIAPSFSWASLNFDEGGISFAPILTHFFCRVLDVGTTLVFEGNEFGSVSSGYVSLQGPLISCAVLLRLDSGGCIEEPRLVIKQKMAPKLEVGATNFDCPLCECVLDTGCESLQRSRGLEHSAVGGFSAGLLILGQYDHGHLYCLILGQLNRNEYQRIGHVVLGYPGAKGKSVAKKFKAWRKDVRIS
ncbi:HET domain-containing protein [Fusarium keratoplasticum]|nr:HET domain-containing protein [Fusarium keratoplasticum]